MKPILNIFRSVRTTNILIFILMGILFAGALVMPLFPSYREINNTNLFNWLSEVPLSESWWLYLAILTIGLLIINTIVCSIESIIKKDRTKRWPLVISPQLIHLGFAFIMLAHFLSSYMAAHGFIVLQEGQGIRFRNGDTLYLERINYSLQKGYITHMDVDLKYITPEGATMKLKSSPNNPAIIRGTGIYLKDMDIMSAKRVLLQISRDPGAVWALVGGMLFIIGTTLLVTLRIRQDTL
ncbi:MAG: cytochrome c biogenesis protein ResB [Nitrospirae bacterium]|nr:cytochrome c biogenesis protein ResB [Nitrospirota bacterium]